MGEICIRHLAASAARENMKEFVAHLAKYVLVGPPIAVPRDDWAYNTGVGVASSADLKYPMDPDHIVLPLRKSRPGAFADTFLIGRASSNDVCLDHDSVSKLHARIKVGGGDGLMLSDAGSRNGTALNGARLTGPKPIEQGDQIVFGRCPFVFFETELLYGALRRTSFLPPGA